MKEFEKLPLKEQERQIQEWLAAIQNFLKLSKINSD